jgi:hypothetical protein
MYFDYVLHFGAILHQVELDSSRAVLHCRAFPAAFEQVNLLTLNIPSGVPPGPQTVIFCDPVVTITTDLLLTFVCVRHQLKINIM